MRELKIEELQSDEAVVRQMITREDELTNQRMLWTAAFNGLLFTALGFAWDKCDTQYLKVVFCMLGVSTSLLNGIALVASARAQRRLLFWWKERKPKQYTGPGVMGADPLDPGKMWSVFVSPWILLAFIFAVGWLAILWFVVTHGGICAATII
jgi:hypothetical protein